MRPILEAPDEPGDLRIAPGLGPKRTRILELAIGELDLGVRERPSGSNRGPDIDRYLPPWARTTPGPPWCAWFASWVLEEALGKVPTGRPRGGVRALRADAEQRHLWRPNVGETLISPGDLFCMDMGGGKGHVGIVVAWDEAGARIATCEGNSGDRVRLGQRSLGDKRITGTIDTVIGEPYRQCFWLDAGEDLGAVGTR